MPPIGADSPAPGAAPLPLPAAGGKGKGGKGKGGGAPPAAPRGGEFYARARAFQAYEPAGLCATGMKPAVVPGSPIPGTNLTEPDASVIVLDVADPLAGLLPLSAALAAAEAALGHTGAQCSTCTPCTPGPGSPSRLFG